MEATNRLRRVLTAAAAAIALAGTALGTAAALDLGGSESHNERAWYMCQSAARRSAATAHRVRGRGHGGALSA